MKKKLQVKFDTQNTELAELQKIREEVRTFLDELNVLIVQHRKAQLKDIK